MRTVIEENGSEKLTVVTHPDSLSIVTEFKGRLPDEINRYKTTILNRDQYRRLQAIGNAWLNGGLK